MEHREEIRQEFISEIVNSSDSDKFEVRKLTPSEALRLQGLTEDEIKQLMNSGISVTDLYKIAGNSISVPCLSAVFDSIINERDDKSVDCFNGDIVQIGHLIDSKSGRVNQSPYRVYSTKGLCPTLMASMGCGGRSPLVVIKNGEYL